MYVIYIEIHVCAYVHIVVHTYIWCIVYMRGTLALTVHLVSWVCSCVVGLVYSGACLQQSIHFHCSHVSWKWYYLFVKYLLSIQHCMQEMCSACVCHWDVVTSWNYSSPPCMSPPPTDSPPTGRLCSRIEALKKELRLGLGKDLFTKAYSVLEGGLGTENEGVGVGGGVSLISWPVSQKFFLLYHSTHQNACCMQDVHVVHTHGHVCLAVHTNTQTHTRVCV